MFRPVSVVPVHIVVAARVTHRESTVALMTSTRTVKDIELLSIGGSPRGSTCSAAVSRVVADVIVLSFILVFNSNA